MGREYNGGRDYGSSPFKVSHYCSQRPASYRHEPKTRYRFCVANTFCIIQKFTFVKVHTFSKSYYHTTFQGRALPHAIIVIILVKENWMQGCELDSSGSNRILWRAVINTVMDVRVT